MLETLTADNLSAVGGVRHGFFSRAWGDCGFNDPALRPQTLANRGRVAGQLSVQPENLLSVYQIHSPDVVTVNEREVSERAAGSS